MKIFSQRACLNIVIMVFIFMGAGCAATHKTTTTQTTQTTVQYPNKEVPNVGQESTSTQIEKSTTTTTSADKDSQPRGILGGFFHVVGSVLAFPFVVVGGLLRMIF